MYNYDQKKLNEAIARYNGDINNNGNNMEQFSVNGLRRRIDIIRFFGVDGTSLNRLYKVIEVEIPILKEVLKQRNPKYTKIDFISSGEQRTLSNEKKLLTGKKLLRAVLQARKEEKEKIEASIESQEEKIKDHQEWLMIIGERIRDILDSAKQLK